MDIYSKARIVWYSIKNWLLLHWSLEDIIIKVLLFALLVYLLYEKPYITVVLVVVILGIFAGIWLLGFGIPGTKVHFGF